MWWKWLPWKYVVRRAARARGFVDPIRVLSRLHALAEPAEVTAPVELLRAGVVFHARGLMNAGVIQHNRDWIWPYWVERQFDPMDESFLPRAFSITHVNLTHRNWTAVGLPGSDRLPIVDPRGLLTPHWDGWSLDGWVFHQDGTRLIPARLRNVQQELDVAHGLSVTTACDHGGTQLQSTVEVVPTDNDVPRLTQTWTVRPNQLSWLVLSLRPYNPEGVSFVHDIRLDSDRRGWLVDGDGRVCFSDPTDQHFTSDYHHGDVSGLKWSEGSSAVHCPVGMATAAAVFRVEADQSREVRVDIPLEAHRHRHWLGAAPPKRPAPTRPQHHDRAERTWDNALQGTTQLCVPDQSFVALHDAALRSLVLHTPGEVYPGPYTYKRFWVRDAAFILHAALCTGLHRQVERALPHLLQRQDRRGYFKSQDGEWDANGQALWLLERYLQLSHRPLPADWRRVIHRAATWIDRKRLRPTDDHPAAGLLPAGFSAEHLGPNDYYLWDDFWSIAGLRAAARMLDPTPPHTRNKFFQVASEMETALDTALVRTDYLRTRMAYPAAPERRLDAGAIGSIVASYPLQLVPADDNRLQGTLEYLLESCLVDGGFFQDMIHSGINPYLTLQLAQVLLRQGDPRSFELIHHVARLASPTGQWPEAIHPTTAGGCMGDGQHMWAAAEWLLAMRSLFVREEGNQLILGSGIPAHWHYDDQELTYGPTCTPWGALTLSIAFTTASARIRWKSQWHRPPPAAHIAIPCFHEQDVDISAESGECTVASCHSCDGVTP